MPLCPACDGMQDHRENNCPKRGDDKWKAVTKSSPAISTRPGRINFSPKSVTWAEPLTTFARTPSPLTPTSETTLFDSPPVSPLAKFEAEECMGAFVDPNNAPQISPSETVGVALSTSSSPVRSRSQPGCCHWIAFVAGSKTSVQRKN
eukprot:g35609.t1